MAGEQGVEPGATDRDVGELVGVGPARPELAPAPRRLVVAMRSSVLVEAEPAAGDARPACQLGGQRRVDVGRDQRDVDRQSELGEQIQQSQQPVVPPPATMRTSMSPTSWT